MLPTGIEDYKSTVYISRKVDVCALVQYRTILRHDNLIMKENIDDLDAHRVIIDIANGLGKDSKLCSAEIDELTDYNPLI